jgi:hypothetical protein
MRVSSSEAYVSEGKACLVIACAVRTSPQGSFLPRKRIQARAGWRAGWHVDPRDGPFV